MTLNKLYTIKSLADDEGFPYKATKIRQLIKEGKLKATKFSSKYMISQAAIDDFLIDDFYHEHR